MSEVLADLATAAVMAAVTFVVLYVARLPAMAVARWRGGPRPARIPILIVVLAVVVGIVAFVAARGVRSCDLGPQLCSSAVSGVSFMVVTLAVVYGLAVLLNTIDNTAPRAALAEEAEAD